jgi:acetyl-CoA carboxylase biotin carboxyl carrier protein
MPQKTFIFICYRRDDASGHMGRLFDHLARLFGKEQVFNDIDAGRIEPGDDFVEVIEDTVGSCWLMLVIIGRQWLDTKNAEGQRRIDHPEDFVRLEIEAALARGIPIIPVLVQNAAMPRSTELPESIAKLARRQSAELSDKRWDYDVGLLVEKLKERYEQFKEVLVAESAAEAKKAEEEERRKAEDELYVITSPLVGVFYRAPSVTDEPFVKVGSQVEPDTVVCIIESMKLMNEIQAEADGTVAEIYVENGYPVEYGQPLFGVKK